MSFVVAGITGKLLCVCRAFKVSKAPGTVGAVLARMRGQRVFGAKFFRALFLFTNATSKQLQ